MPKNWRGDIAFSDNMAIFRGHVGDNKRHSHWASQITIALDGEIEFESASGLMRSQAVYFASKTEHRLLSGFVCSIYFDPMFDAIPKTLKEKTRDGCAPLCREDLPDALGAITKNTDLTALVNSPPFNLTDLTSSSNARLQNVIQEVKTKLSEGVDVDRDYLAQLVHLSPTRFSHWFVEQTGVPLRSYKKWLKLRVAMDALLEGISPMNAAMLAGFSDLTHMSREFSDSFGLTYLDAQRAWEHVRKN
ncbi:MAG: helix-turn-helix transcriptional regulator [Hahellaceae bacterium]|nr:helix-turn-helix transcriptional regulator [Hahellaceae bacterium]MCP5212732.1 helix-turn-helix transcriptional regulator [Hahellaceae bacterium]